MLDHVIKAHLIRRPGVVPNFLIPGAPRSGTSTLVEVLSRHPEVYVPAVKEIQYFTAYYHHQRDWYVNQFQPKRGERAIGEASTRYMVRPEAAKRIYELNADFKLIFLLRNPIKRAYSHYKREVSTRGVAASFRHCIERSDHYLRPGMYAEHLTRFLRYFPMEQIHIVLFEDLVRDPGTTLGGICEFLEVAPETMNSWRLPRVNAARVPLSPGWQRRVHERFGAQDGESTWQRYLKGGVRYWASRLNQIGAHEFAEMDPEVEQRLADLYADDVQALSELLGRDLMAIWGISCEKGTAT